MLLSVVVTVEGMVRPAASVQLVGSPGSRVDLERSTYTDPPERGLLLAPLTEPLSESVTALVRADDELTIPAADVDRFRRDYYPRLRQAITVTSSDGGVDLPEIHPPRLLLRVAFPSDSPQQVSLEWWFTYRIGDATTADRNGRPTPAVGGS